MSAHGGNISNWFKIKKKPRIPIYKYHCGWCGRNTNSEYTAYTTLGAITHLCHKCRTYYQEFDKLPDNKNNTKYG